MGNKDAIKYGALHDERCIKGCAITGPYIVTITLQHLTLYNEEFNCIGDIDYQVFHPNSICSRGSTVVVSFERPKEEQKYQKEQKNQKEKKLPKFYDILTYKLKLPGCGSDTKLVKGSGFNTEGECFTTAVCPLNDKNLTIAVGMEVESHPHMEDIRYQVQIIKANGKVLQTLDINPLGEPCFNSEFFLCTTMKFSQIVVSEVKLRRVRGIELKTGKTVFQFDGGAPQGITCDLNDNIYMYNEGQMYWIPALRNKIHYMQQEYAKKVSKKDQRLEVYISYNDTNKTLYKTCTDRGTIETYTVIG